MGVRSSRRTLGRRFQTRDLVSGGLFATVPALPYIQRQLTLLETIACCGLMPFAETTFRP
jgi:hypothetical protein